MVSVNRSDREVRAGVNLYKKRNGLTDGSDQEKKIQSFSTHKCKTIPNLKSGNGFCFWPLERKERPFALSACAELRAQCCCEENGVLRSASDC